MKTTAVGDSNSAFERSALIERGFVGWASFAHLRNTDACPDVCGVYVVARSALTEPAFVNQSCGGWFKGRDPTVTAAELRANWVSDATIVYIGKANNIRRRLREFAKFGAGQNIGHWGGRLIWQLADSDELVVAWMPTPGRDPLVVEAGLIMEFRSLYGKPPFANEPHRLGQ